MADFSGLLGVLAGGLSGYSTGSGLDLAAKLREQAALDEMAVQKYQQFSDIRGQAEKQDWQMKQEALNTANLQAKLGSIMELAPQLDPLGIENEGFEGEDLHQRLQKLSMGEASALEGAMRGRISAVTGQAEMERESAKSAAEAADKYASATKDLSVAGWYDRRPGEASDKPTKPSIVTRADGTYAVYQMGGQVVSVKLEGVPGQAPGSSTTDKASATTKLKAFDTALEEVKSFARQHPEQYALKNADDTMQMDENDVPVLDMAKIAEEAQARATSRVRWAEGGTATEDDGENPAGNDDPDNAEDIIARLKAQGFSPEEIQMMAALEGIDYDPESGPFR
jgi:hypothetical protein